MKLNKFADLSKRMAVSLSVLCVLSLLIVFALNPIVNVVIILLVCMLVGTGVWEYAHIARSKGVEPAVFLMILVAVAEVIAFFSAHRWIHSQELPIFVFAIGLGLFFLNRFRKAEEALINVAVDFFGVAYIAVPLSFTLAILYPTTPPSVEDGRWWLFYLIAVTKITDIGAYFVGRIFGKKPLAPVLSPKKTIEGAVGGFICAVLFSIAVAYLGNIYSGSSFKLSYMNALCLGGLIGIFGQIGDLAESLLKRDAEVKDSNKIPGIGGVLDMIDSLLFTAPIVYFYLNWYRIIL